MFAGISGRLRNTDKVDDAMILAARIEAAVVAALAARFRRPVFRIGLKDRRRLAR